MSKSFMTFVIALSVGALFAVPFQAQAPAARAQTIAERTSAMQKLDGFFPLYWDERAGTLWLEIPRFNTEVLFTTGLAEGLGSNDIGLDRGSAGGGRIVTFERVGPKVFVVQPNTNFRSSRVSKSVRSPAHHPPEHERIARRRTYRSDLTRSGAFPDGESSRFCGRT